MTTYKQTEGNVVTWTQQDAPDAITTGAIVKGRIRQETINDETADYDEWQRMLEQEAAGEITIDWWTQEEKQALADEKARQQFKQSRQAQLDNAIVTTQSGKQFDADEASIIRLGNALVAADGEPDDTIIKWSLANDGTGVMTDCAKAEIKEAHRLAMENMSAIWSV